MQIFIQTSDDGTIERLQVAYKSSAGGAPVAYEHVAVDASTPGQPARATVLPVPPHVTATIAWAAELLTGTREAHLRAQLIEHGGVAADQVDELIAKVKEAKERGPR